MKKIFSIAILALFSLTKAQFSVNVEAGSTFLSKDAILYILDGSKDIILSKEVKKGNQWKFTVPHQYIGMMKIYFPEHNNSVTFVSENKDVKINLQTDETKIKEIVYLDDTNILMEKIQADEKKSDVILPALVQIKDYYKDSSEFGAALKNEIQRLKGKTVVSAEKNPFIAFYEANYQRFVSENPDKKLPSSQEIINFISNSDEKLESSSLMRPVLLSYLNSGNPQNVAENVDLLLEKLNVETPRGQTVLSELIDIFDIYDMPEMKEKYLTKAKNLKCTIHNRLATTLKINKNVEMGAKFPDYKFNSAKNTLAKSIYDVKADQKIVVFWSSTCSHCEKELPVLLEKYSQLKSKKIEIIGFSLDTEKSAYESRVAALPWINDSELRGWNSSFTETYNVHATPTYFVLDSENKIIAKPDHASDVLQFFGLK